MKGNAVEAKYNLGVMYSKGESPWCYLGPPTLCGDFEETNGCNTTRGVAFSVTADIAAYWARANGVWYRITTDIWGPAAVSMIQFPTTYSEPDEVSIWGSDGEGNITEELCYHRDANSPTMRECGQ